MGCAWVVAYGGDSGDVDDVVVGGGLMQLYTTWMLGVGRRRRIDEFGPGY